MRIYSNCLFVAGWLWFRYGGRIITRRSCAGDFTHYLHEAPNGLVRQFVPLNYEQRRIPRIFFRGRVIEGDYHGQVHLALHQIGYSYDQIDGLQPEQLIELFEGSVAKSEVIGDDDQISVGTWPRGKYLAGPDAVGNGGRCGANTRAGRGSDCSGIGRGGVGRGAGAGCKNGRYTMIGGGFTAPEIREAFNFAELAYRGHDQLKMLFGSSITIIDPLLPELGDACYIIDEGDRAVVMFPGSNDVLDWALNLDARDEHGLHAGFLRGLESMAEEILERLGQLRPAAIFITGHSRGGALADMMLERLGHHLIDSDIDCITFAQPRIATAAYYAIPSIKQMPSVRYLRVHNDGDPAPHLPPSRWGWVHHGPDLAIGQSLTRMERLRRWWGRWQGGDRGLIVTPEHQLPAYRRGVMGL